MMIKIKGEQPFQVLNGGFSASPSAEDIELYYSADGFSYSKYPKGEIPAGNVIEVTNCFSRCLFFKLVGNNSDLVVNF